MDRLRRRDPRSGPSDPSSMKPPRPPRGPSFQASEASRPLPVPSSPGCDAKTTEYKFFKKLREQSGCRSHSFSKQNKDTRMESHNVMPDRKLPAQKSILSSEETPATPSKNEEIYHEQVNEKASHHEYDNNDTPQLNPHDYLPNIHVHTPITQISFEAVGISRNSGIEPWSGQIFSEKRGKILKLAAKTMSMESSEFLQRRSEVFTDILQRLGTNNMMKKHHKESMRLMKVCGHTPTGPECHFRDMLDYRLSEFGSPTKLITGKESSSYTSRDARQCMTLPWGYNRGCSSSLDWKIDLPQRSNEACESMALPWVHTGGLSDSSWKRDTAHNQVSNLLLEDVQPHTKSKPASASESDCIIETRPCAYHGWEPSAGLSGSIPNRFSIPCQVEKKHVSYDISNTFWQPDLRSPLEQCFPPSVRLEGQSQKEAEFSDNYGAGLLEQFISSSVGLEGQDQHEAGLFNYDTGLQSSFHQLHAKCSASSFLDTRNGILNHSDFSYISNLPSSESSNIVSNADRSCLNSIFSTSEHPFQLSSKRLHDSSVHISSLVGLEEKYSTEAGIFDNSDIGPTRGLDQSSFSNYTSGVLDHHRLRYMPPKGSSTLFMDANDAA
uniref:Uncharacterized protein n=1 Tax=Leersia perrieri TaxID=77586 RepID=A0A0D9VIC2_9ORYZ